MVQVAEAEVTATEFIPLFIWEALALAQEECWAKPRVEAKVVTAQPKAKAISTSHPQEELAF